MAAKKEYLKTLDKYGQEKLRIRLTVEKGKILDLVFQYESFIQECWREIVRYDMAHGFFHRDFIFPNGTKEKIRIEMLDLRSAAMFAEQDIKDKWEFYKSKYSKELKKKSK